MDMKAAGNDTMLVIIALMVAVFMLIILMRNIDFRNTPEAKAFEIANTIALYINQLSAAEEGSVRLEFNDEYSVGMGNNQGFGVWIKQKLAVILPAFLNDKWLARLEKQTPQGVYVIVEPKETKRKESEQYAYVAAYTLFTGELKEPQLGTGSAVCIEKAKDKIIAEVSLC